MVYAFPLLTCSRPLRSCYCGSFVWQSFSPRLFQVFSKRGWSKKRMGEKEGSYGVRQPHRRLSRPNSLSGYPRRAKLVFFVFIQQRIALHTLRVKITRLRVSSVSLRIECLGSMELFACPGVLPRNTCTGMCCPTGSWFSVSWFRTGYPFWRRFLKRGIIFWTRESSSNYQQTLKIVYREFARKIPYWSNHSHSSECDQIASRLCCAQYAIVRQLS